MIYTYQRLEQVGRLGNQCHQVAATIAFARRDGGSVALPPSWIYRPYLSVPDAFFSEIGDDTIDGGTEYYQDIESIKIVQEHFDRAYFAPSPMALDRLYATYGTILGSGTHYTAIHVRRTDYLRHPRSFPPVPPRYYQAALAAVRTTHPDTTVIVFSDDIRWCRVNMTRLGWDGPTLFASGNPTPVPLNRRPREPDDIIDLMLMARCQRHILSNSTFCWWGAYLSDDPEPVYPWPWFGPNVIESGFPDHWLRLQV